VYGLVCPCGLSLFLVPVACPCKLALLPVPVASTVYRWETACLCCLSLFFRFYCLVSYVFLLPVIIACPCCLFIGARQRAPMA
jgi:hypothetical protein